jgi:hypothetical protein
VLEHLHEVNLESLGSLLGLATLALRPVVGGAGESAIADGVVDGVVGSGGACSSFTVVGRADSSHLHISTCACSQVQVQLKLSKS